MDGDHRRAEATVMVVDDTEAGRHAMIAVLRRAGHHDVPAADADEALAELDVRTRAGTLPDVVLAAAGLPGTNGFELCRRIKALPGAGAVSVVLFSAADDSRDRRHALDAGADTCLAVPAEPGEIRAVVAAAARGARARTGTEALVQRLTLLSETIVSVQTARRLGQLADSAAEGTSRLTGVPAAVFVLGTDGDLYCGTSRQLPRAALLDPDTRQSVARLVRQLMAGHTGARSSVVPAPLWPHGVFGSDAHDDVRLVLARAQAGKSTVCLATPLGPGHRPEPETEALVARLAQATSLAAEPLFMYQAERHVALTLQHSFLPQPHRLPELPGADVVVRYVPASRQTEIGGDFYAALPTSEGILTAVGDVVGHSLEAATVMVEIRHALRAYCIEDGDPAVLARRLDRMLRHYHPDVTATVCLVLVEPATGRTRIANAGHIPPLVVRDGGSAEYVKVTGPLLGVGLDHPPPTEIALDPADRLLLVTDGLIETRGTDLAVSMERLRVAAADAPAGTAALCDTLLDCFGHEGEDDIALLALRLTDDLTPGGEAP
ncbi:SpoIIE family protein phosphatase [Streptomyces sp. NPDC008313]|uniref:SpoIIE family protein phosphatase n=1 Tax=Streptomyces sp. NPDC008313 TaxID=3364826 RepID=UPI0036E10578